MKLRNEITLGIKNVKKNLLYGLSFKEGVNHQEIERLKTFFAKKILAP